MTRALSLVLALGLAAPASAAEPPPPTTVEEPARPGRKMAIAGTVLIIASAAGYITMAVGLGLGNEADAEVRALQATDDLQRRRDVMQRGQLGNRLALGAGLASVALMATGVALVVVGRRRAAAADAPKVGVLPLQRGAGLQLGARF